MNGTPYVTNTITGVEDPDPPLALEHLLPTDAEVTDMLRATPRSARRRGCAPARPGRVSFRLTEDKRHRLQRAATVLWAKEGMTACSARSIARSTEVPQSMLFYLLGTRDRMLTDILLHHIVTLSERVRAASQRSSEASPPQRLEAMLTACVDGIAAAPHAHTLLHNALCVLPPTSRDVVRRRYRMLLDLLAQPLAMLAPAAESGLAAGLVLGVLGSVNDALLWVDPAREQDRKPEAAATVRRLMAMLLAAVGSAAGLGPHPG